MERAGARLALPRLRPSQGSGPDEGKERHELETPSGRQRAAAPQPLQEEEVEGKRWRLLPLLLGVARRRRARVPIASQQQGLLSQARAERASRWLAALARSIPPSLAAQPRRSSFSQLLFATLLPGSEPIGARALPFRHLGGRKGAHTHAPLPLPSLLFCSSGLATAPCSSMSQSSLAGRVDFLVDWLWREVIGPRAAVSFSRPHAFPPLRVLFLLLLLPLPTTKSFGGEFANRPGQRNGALGKYTLGIKVENSRVYYTEKI